MLNCSSTLTLFQIQPLFQKATPLVMEDIRKAISEAERELEAAEKAVASKRNALMASFFCSVVWAPHVPLGKTT